MLIGNPMIFRDLPLEAALRQTKALGFDALELWPPQIAACRTDALRRHADFLGQPILAKVHWLQKFFQQDFAGVNRGKFLHRARASVRVDNFHIQCLSGFKTEAHAPLIVDADAPLSFVAALQGFLTVLGRDAQILDALRPFQLFQLAPGDTFDVDEARHPFRSAVSAFLPTVKLFASQMKRPRW